MSTLRGKLRWVLAWAGLWLALVATALAGPIEDVSQASYTSYLGVAAPGSPPGILYTHLGDNRGNGPEHDLARTNILNTLLGFGLTTYLDPFVVGGNTYYNVVATKPGLVNPGTIYILGAHYDSVNNPGADDNASGVAGVLEAARVLSAYNFAATLIFIAFDREEQGLWGSNAYATAHATDNIQGMVSLDMIAYNPAGATHDTALIYGRSSSNPLKLALAAALAAQGITASIQGQLDASDHAPFEWQGKQAALLIEGAVWSNPNYHQPTDSVDTLNYIDYYYATQMTRGAVAYVTGAAGLLENNNIPEPSCVVLLIVFGAIRLRRLRR